MAQTNKVEVINSHNTLSDQFAKWLYIETENNKVVNIDMAMKMLYRLRPGYRFNENDTRRYICKASEYWENHHNDTVINIRRTSSNPGGWTRATKETLETKLAKVCHTTVKSIERALRLKLVAEQRGIDFEASKRQFIARFSKQLERMSPSARRYHEIYIKNLLEQKKSVLENKASDEKK